MSLSEAVYTCQVICLPQRTQTNLHKDVTQLGTLTAPIARVLYQFKQRQEDEDEMRSCVLIGVEGTNVRFYLLLFPTTPFPGFALGLWGPPVRMPANIVSYDETNWNHTGSYSHSVFGWHCGSWPKWTSKYVWETFRCPSSRS